MNNAEPTLLAEALATPMLYTVSEVAQLLQEHRFLLISFMKKDGTETNKIVTVKDVPAYEKKTDRVRPPRDPNYMALWSVKDEGYRTIDVTKITDILVMEIVN
jgi:hypothetical protein